MENLQSITKSMRVNILKMVHNAQSGHPGGSLSATDILAVLYFRIMNINKENVKDAQRDKFILSKGHASPALYAVLKEKGFISQEDLMTFRLINSNIQGHPNMRDTLGVDASTGSLGQGLAIGVGISLANRLNNLDYCTYVLCGDGECQEGELWEAAMAAGHYHLDNLCVIVDHNKLQIDGRNDDVMKVEPLDKKFEAFGFEVLTVDGHDLKALEEVLNKAKTIKGKPVCVIAETVKGKGVSFMENQAGWHGKAPSDEQLEQALKELGGNN